MALRMGETGKRTALLLLIGTVLAVLAWAFIDGGREPIRLIEQPLPPPEQAR